MTLLKYRTLDRSRPGVKKIRYAVVGLGNIAQVAVLPGFKHAKNSELVALVSSDEEKLRTLGRKYGVKCLYSYEQFETCLCECEVDAVYIALPNDLHREYTERAAKLGVHVLCEKPMAVRVRDCEAMARAAESHRVKLMIAYRLHFEPANLEAIEICRSGKLGDLRIYNSVFSYIIKGDNIRVSPRAEGGGPLFDIGIYCLNAARYLFRAEPTEVLARAIEPHRKPFTATEETMSVILKFPGERVANFTCSFGSARSGSFTVIGTKGSLSLENAFEYAGEREMKVTIGEKKTQTKKFVQTDQFGPELVYFSNCILKGKNPEPSAQEGIDDLRVIEAIFKSASTGRAVPVHSPTKTMRPSKRQRIRRPAVKEPQTVKAEGASK